LSTPLAEPTSGGLLSIGRVVRAHGLKGELRVEPFFEGSDALAQVEELWLSARVESADGAQRFELEWARAVPKAFLVKLKGVEERNGAEALRGRTVWVARDALEVDEDAEYYLVDLIGAKVVGPDGDVGTVTESATHPRVDARVIELSDGRKLEQPLIPEFVARVSVAEKLVELSTLDGLIG
jgi:16S rRNA processing protein RimM